MWQPIPKFGDWDESDPKAGEDYTYKFNKVKDEKKNISEMFSAALSSEPNNGVNTNNHEKSFSISKVCSRKEIFLTPQKVYVAC